MGNQKTKKAAHAGQGALQAAWRQTLGVKPGDVGVYMVFTNSTRCLRSHLEKAIQISLVGFAGVFGILLFCAQVVQIALQRRISGGGNRVSVRA